MNKRDRRVVRTHRAIRDAYFDLIKEKDTIKISISEIARRADIDRKTFYLHYNSPEEVLDEYMEEIIGEMHDALQSSEYGKDPFNVEVVFKVVADTQNRDMDFLQIISKSDSYDELWVRSRDALVAQALSVYRNKIKVPSEETKIRIEFFATGVLDIYRRWLRGEYKVNFKKMTSIVNDVSHNGIQIYSPRGGSETPSGSDGPPERP